MRIIIILVVLAIIGLLAARQLQAPAPSPDNRAKDTPPAVPTRPQDVPKFQKDMNQFMEDQGKKQHDRIEQESH